MTQEYHLYDNDLPTWMRQARQIADWGVVIVFCFSLIIAMPFVMQSDIPRTTDLENYAYLSHSYAEALREGRLYPRWIAGAMMGYGAPIGNYYPPATPYLVAIVDLFFTNDTLIAMRLVAIIAIVLCGVMTYLFMLRQMGAEYAVLASLLYVYSPIIGLTVPYVLGDLPLLLASALLPMSLWSLGRIFTCKNPLDGIILALICAMLWLTHLEMALVTHGIILLFCISKCVLRGLQMRKMLIVLLAMIAGIGLSAFFWLPAWVEQDLATWIRAPYQPLMPNITLNRLLMPIIPVDISRQVQLPQIGFGFAGMLFFVLGIIGIIRQTRYRRILLFWGICACLMLLVALFVQPQALWVLVPIAFCLAIWGSGAYSIFNQAPYTLRRLALPLLVAIGCLLSLPVWLAPRWSDEQGTDLGDYAQIVHEQLGYGVAVLPPHKPIPITLPQPILPNRALISGYQSDSVVRIPQNRLTPSKQAGLIISESHRDRYLIQTESPAIFEVLRAYAPGWVASVDGVTMNVAPNTANGLLQIGVPRPSSGILTISYESTPIRQSAWWVTSGVALILLLVGLFATLRPKPSSSPMPLGLLTIESSRLMGIILAGFGVFFALFIMPFAPYPIYPQAGHSLNHFVAQAHRTDVGIEMLGYDVSQTTYQVGDVLRVQVAWRTARRLTDNYQVVVFLQSTDGAGFRWLQTPPRYLAGYPTRRWALDKHLIDEYHISLTDALARGDYRLVIEVYRCQTICLRENRVNFFTQNGNFIGSQVALSAIFRVE